MEFRHATPRAFREEVPIRPQNARFFANRVLLEIVEGVAPKSTPAALRRAKAELTVRFFLDPTGGRGDAAQKEMSRVRDIVRAWIGAPELAAFVEDCDRICRRTQLGGGSTMSVLQGLRKHLVRLPDKDADALLETFRPWLEADGVIPVFNAERASFLPFVFTDERHAKEVMVCDWKGNPLEEWTRYLRELANLEGLDRNVQVAFEESDFVTSKGDSLMLPLLMAWWRLHGELPLYNKVRFMATGSFHGGMLGEVAVDLKLMAVSAIRDGRLAYPGDGSLPGMLYKGDRRNGVLRELQILAEEDYDLQPEYAVKRLVDLEASAHGRNAHDWNGLIGRLDHLMESLDRDLDPEAYLDCLMLRSSANCHAGCTETSRLLNAQAMEIACTRESWLAKCLRLRIEELVILQDEEDFDRIFALEASLLADIEAFDRVECHSLRSMDLLMRYHGTIAQFKAYATLRGLSRCSAEMAFRHFRHAFDLACEINERSHAANRPERLTALENCTRDANYLVLWAALFKPESVPEAAMRAARYAGRLADLGSPDDAFVNTLFRNRYVALAQYRTVLFGCSKPKVEDLPADFKEVRREWIRATGSKYLGAVAAAEGNVEKAVELFKEAVEAMGGCTSGLFAVIRMTVLSEAYRSLRRHPEANALALDYRRQALELFATYGDDAQLVGKRAWRDWLQTEGDDAEFPGRNYWY